MFSELELKLLSEIQKFNNENQSGAYVELLCNNILGEVNENNINNIIEALKKLEDKNRILINGDRISIRKSHLLYASHDFEEVERFKNSNLEFNELKTDIGHGCEIPSIGFELIHSLWGMFSMAISVGANISQINEVLKGLKYIKDFFKERLSNEDCGLYYGEELLIAIAINEIMKKYKGKSIDSLKLVGKVKVNLSGLGLYSRMYYGFNEDSLEGTPDTLNYFAFELQSPDINNTFDIIRVEIKSNGKILSYNMIPSGI